MIEHISLDRFHVPLTTPYRLSTVTVTEFDVAIVRVQTTDGSTGLGEVTSLEGYSAESGDQAWENLQQVGERLPGRSVSDAITHVESALSEYPFSATALTCALETATSHDWAPIDAPIVGILSARDQPAHRRQSLADQLEEGFETIKIKIGFDPETDAAAVAELASQAPESVSFRVDANQGYSLAEARTFIAQAPTDRIEHVEQPLPVDSLDEHAILTADHAVDIVLDEDVTTAEDLDAIERAVAADGVKFKLMKCGGLDRAERLIEDTTNRGFTVIFGNGVQSEIGCLLEASVWAQQGLETVGEFNGWLKQSTATLSPAIELRNGTLHWDESKPVFDEKQRHQYRIDAAQFGSNE